MRMIGRCPSCGAEDALSGLMYEGPVVCGKCKNTWKNMDHAQLHSLIVLKKLMPLAIIAKRDQVWLKTEEHIFNTIPNRDLLLHQLAIQLRNTFHFEIEIGQRDLPVAVSGTFLGAPVRFEWALLGLKFYDRTPVPIPSRPAPGLERNKNKVYAHGNVISYQVIRWYCKLLNIWCFDDIPGLGRGRVFKPWVGSRQAVGRQKEQLRAGIQARLEKRRFSIFKRSLPMLDIQF